MSFSGPGVIWGRVLGVLGAGTPIQDQEGLFCPLPGGWHSGGVVFHLGNSLRHRDPLIPREDITYRLPELDPRGSDEENLDSETSASTESLLEERAGRGASEGQY